MQMPTGKQIIIAQALIIIVLLGIFILGLRSDYVLEKEIENGLLSKRVYSGLIDETNYFIVHYGPLRENLTAYIDYKGNNISVYVENLRNGAYMGINEKRGYTAASLTKVPIAILVMRKVEEMGIPMDTMLTIREEYKDPSFGNLVATEEAELPLYILMEKMLSESDNTAEKVLLYSLFDHPENLQFLYDYYGIDVQINGSSHNITPKAMSTVFSSLFFSSALEAKNSEYILSLMEETVFDIKSVADLPDDVRVVHKFGTLYTFDNNVENPIQNFHDCGILYIEDSRFLYCVMTEGTDPETAIEEIGFIVHEIHSYIKGTKEKLEMYKTATAEN